MAVYELWQMRTRNIVGSFATKAEALAVVRQAAEAQGETFVETLFLGHEDSNGRSRPIAQGPDLLRLALAATETAPR